MRIWLTAVFALASLACGVTEPIKKEPVQKYHLHGIIRKLDPAAQSATVEHQNIKGFMDAMTMEFPVKERSEFTSLHTGDVIDATLFVQGTNFWIGEIKKAEANKSKPGK